MGGHPGGGGDPDRQALGGSTDCFNSRSNGLLAQRFRPIRPSRVDVDGAGPGSSERRIGAERLGEDGEPWMLLRSATPVQAGLNQYRGEPT